MAYTINININGDFEAINGVSGGENEPAGVSKTKQTSNEQEKAAKALGAYVASQTIEPFVQNVKSVVSTNIGLVTGNIELQDRVNFAFEVAQYGVNAFKNAQAGAVAGMAFGLSGAVGGLIGLGLTAVNTGMQIAFNQLQINTNKKLENYQIQQIRERQGLAYNKSRS